MAEVLLKEYTWTTNYAAIRLIVVWVSDNPNGGTYGTKRLLVGADVVNTHSTNGREVGMEVYVDGTRISSQSAYIPANLHEVLCYYEFDKNASNATGAMPNLTIRAHGLVQNNNNEIREFDKTYTLSLSQIDRKSSFTINQSSVTAGGSVTFSITRKYSSATHTLQYTAPSVSSWTNIVTGVATSYTWTPPATIMKAAASGTVKVRIIAYQGSSAINTTDAKSFTFTIPNNSTYQPSISNLALTDAAMWSGSTSFLAKFGKMLTGLSKPKVTWTESAKSGASISARLLTLSGSTVAPSTNSYTAGVVSGAGTSQVTALTLKDSRGFSSTGTHQTNAVQVLKYTAPSASGSDVYRSDQNGVKADEGTYISARIATSKTAIPNASSEEQNFVTVKIYVDGTLKQTLTETASAHITSSAIVIDTLAIGDSANVIVEVTDTVGKSTSVSMYVAPAVRVMSFKEDGTGVAFGKISDQAGFECEWDASFNGDLLQALDTSATSGDDKTIYDALTYLGWTDVLS